MSTRYHLLRTGGFERVVYDLAEVLGAQGHDVYVLAPGGSRDPHRGTKETGDHWEALTVIDGGPHNPEPEAYEKVKASLREYDIIHSSSWGGHAYIAAKEMPALQGRVLQTLHGPLQWRSMPYDRPNFVAASATHARFLQEEAGFNCRVVPHGIDLSLFPCQTVKDDYLLSLARVSPEKGTLEFVRLCVAAKMHGIVAGEDVEVPDPAAYVRRVMQACEDSGGLVRYMGRVSNDQRLELLQGARCLVSPLGANYVEAFGLATVEALACGTPVLTTANGGGRDIVVPGTGVVVATNEAAALLGGLHAALNETSTEACRARAEEFSRERMAQGYLALYEALRAGERW